MFVFVFGNLLVIPLFILAHPHIGTMARDFVVPGIQGGATSTSVLLIIAIVGTTVAPWQLFFQQSNVIDKRITPRWINYERLDTYVGAVVVVVGAAALVGIRPSPSPTHAVLRSLHRRGRSRLRRSTTRSDRRPERCSPWCS